MFKIIHAQFLAPNVKRFVIEAPRIARKQKPGQFVILRIYEGCGRAYIGEVEGANIIKIHRRSDKISYLIYPDFETGSHSVGCYD